MFSRILPASFRFSPLLTIISIALALLMLWASRWQWERYKFKVALVETYAQNSVTPPLPFPTSGESKEVFENVMHRKVELSGTYDFDHQLIVINRSHATGPGSWLVTPLKIDGTDSTVLVSRGFIPFADSTIDSWQKYNFSQHETLRAVVQESTPSRSALVPANTISATSEEAKVKWLYADLEKISKFLPYPIITTVYLQRLGGPPSGNFPAESISIDVPPSTHFGYTIEWILLAIATLTISFVLQAFPRRKLDQARHLLNGRCQK